jgi:predicted dehydrogenase
MRQHPRDVNIALVGCGRIAESHVAVMRTLPDCHLLAAIDVRSEVAETVAKATGARAYTDYRQALEHERLDGVVVCTPPALHAEIACVFLEAGIHVLCEKPLAVSSTQAEQMLDSAVRGDAVLMMASKFRYVRDIVQARSIVQAGLLGDIILYENSFCGRTDMRGKWYAQPELSGGGVLIDNGSHSVDIARFLLGPVAHVQAQEGKSVQGLGVEDSVDLYFRTAADVLGTVHLSWSIPKDLDDYIDLWGTEGQLCIGWRGSKYRQSERLHWVPFGEGYRKVDAMARQMRNFVDVINGVDRPVITESEALASVRVIETAYRSLTMNKWVAVEDSHVVAAR